MLATEKAFMKILLTTLLSVAGLACGIRENADLLLINGKVITLDDTTPVAEAIAVRDGRIISVGSSNDLQQRFIAAHFQDLKGATVVPGLNDAHLHVMGVGRFLMRLNLVNTDSYAQIVEMVKEKTKSMPSHSWIKGRGWDQNDWADKNFPLHQALSEISPNHFVVLDRIDGHAKLVNKNVLDLAGISRSTPDPAGGKIVRDSNGDPTGVLIDNAELLVTPLIPSSSFEEDSLALSLALDAFASAGLTAVQDAGADSSDIELYKRFAEQNLLTARIYVMLDGSIPGLLSDYFHSGPQRNLYNHFLNISSVKIYADGALGSRGAALLQPYDDAPDQMGLLVTDPDTILSITARALKAGFQVCTHAIGDRGNRIVLDAYEKAMLRTQTYGLDKRLRIEHAQVVEEKDFKRFAKLGMVASMQPTHCTSDMYWAVERVGRERILGAYAWQTFLKQGTLVAGGSDAPVESYNPLWGIFAAVTRQDQKGYPDHGWYPDQRMSEIQALKAFTQWAAYAAFEESDRGTIKPGQRADLTILDRPITDTDPLNILEARVLMTIVDGRLVFKQEAPQNK